MMKRANCVFDEISIEAEWWLPGKPETRIRGKLSGRVAGDFYLVTEGPLDGESESPPTDLIILGESKNGDRISLLQCFRTQGSGLPDFVVPKADTTYFAHWILVGAHFQDYQEVRFSRLSFGATGLEEWYGLECFDITADFKARTASIAYKNPAPVAIAEVEGAKVSLGYNYVPPGWSVGQQEARIEHGARITVEVVDGTLPLHQWGDSPTFSFLEAIQRVEAFLSLAVNGSVYTYDIIGYLQVDRPDGTKHLTRVEIHRIRSIQSAPEPMSWHKMLFCWKHIAGNPRHHLEQWMQRVRGIGMSVWLYLGSFREQVYDDQRFMELAQALEGFHRYRHPEQSKPTDEHKQKLSAIMGSCLEEHREWLGKKLTYSHEPSLRERLKSLFAEHTDAMEWLCQGKDKVKSTIETIVTNRNAYAHCADGDTHADFTGFLRHRTVRAMQALMALLLMEEAGFSCEQTTAIAKGSWSFGHLRRYFDEGQQAK